MYIKRIPVPCPLLLRLGHNHCLGCHLGHRCNSSSSSLCLLQLPLLHPVVGIGPVQLGRRRDGHKDVHGEQAIVLGYDDQRVPGPDETGGRQRARLGQRQLISGSRQVRESGNDEALQINRYKEHE